MTTNLLETIRKNLGYPELRKIDPAIQDAVFDPTNPLQARLGQAAIPSVLVGLYKFLKTQEAVYLLLYNNDDTSWIKLIFGNKSKDLLKRIASYSTCKLAIVKLKINEIASEAVHLIKKHLNNITSIEEKANAIKNIITAERHNILPYLPAVLNIGELLGDTTLDDKTNKMEGPVSSLMHKIEQGFSK